VTELLVYAAVVAVLAIIIGATRALIRRVEERDR
jgi:hypothetical protein